MRKTAVAIATAAILITACSSAVGARFGADRSTDQAEQTRAAASVALGGGDKSYDSVEQSRAGAFQVTVSTSGGGHPHGRPHLGGSGTNQRGK